MNASALPGVRYAIVTGAAAGIGQATLRLLVSQGWQVGAFDVDEDGLRDLVTSLGADRVFAGRLDVTDEAGWANAVAEFGDWSGGRLDLLVNNAGIIAVGRFIDIPVDRMRRLLDINVVGVLNGIHACIPLLKASHGRIINVSSIAALTGWAYAAAYSASKGAVHNLTEALAAELKPLGITVCDVLPGFVATQLVGDDEEVAALRASFKALSIAFTSPKRVAGVIVAAIDSNRLHHIVGKQGRVYGFLTRYMPRLGRMMTRTLADRYARTLDALQATRTAREGAAKMPPDADENDAEESATADALADFYQDRRKPRD